jgi:hypothetical protein
MRYPEATIIEHDLVKNKLPHLDQPTLKAISTKDPVEAESLKEAAYLSNQLVGSLRLIAKTDLSITLLQFMDYFRPYAAATRHKFQIRIHFAQHIGRSMSEQDQAVGRRVWDCH